ncbi:DNA cytosine methyltransferase [Lentilactobacillus hilgardii]|uniref:DNA cytosine methyltransferase n=4 Tax=Lentilactobacillus hilgardii TaxID=1588 RepID=UPI001CC1DB75|nr:DNA cytosine methyltransferase [Lentilactobacillus hilgardii]
MKGKNMVLKAIDLFSGSGGTTAGLKKAGISVVGAVEIDPVASETYKYNNPEVNLIIGDIKNVTGNALKEKAKLDKEDQLLLVACPPCQGFSSIRNGGEDDIRNELVFEFLRLIQELQPDYVLMENVSGMSRGKGKVIFKEFYQQLQIDYDLVYDILNSADYGIPQIRKRLVLHGIRKDHGKVLNNIGLKLQLPESTFSKNGDEKRKKWRTAKVIMDLPPIKAGEEYIDPKNKIFNHVSNDLSDLNKKRIRFIRKHGGDRASLPKKLTQNWHRNLKLHKDVYGILDISKPAITMTGGCMTFSKGRFGHPTEDRALSAREAARLQSFDDSYKFFGNRGQLARQIGNAVPVNLAKASGSYFIGINQLLLGAK